MMYHKLAPFFFYVVMLTYIVFFSPGRERFQTLGKAGTEPPSIHLIPFSNTIAAYDALSDHSLERRLWFTLTNFFGNILLFIPFPLVLLNLGFHNRQSIIAWGVACSVLIEFIQYALQIGVADIDDVVLNSTGIFTGNYLWKLHTKKRVIG